MARFKRLRRYNFKKKYGYFIVIFLIIFNVVVTFSYYSTNLSEKMLDTFKKSVNNIIINIVNGKSALNIIKNADINDLITIEYNNEHNKILDVNYNLENAYDVMIEFKNFINSDIQNLNELYFPPNVRKIKDNIAIQLPLFSISDKALISNLGPKINAKVILIKSVYGSVNTKIRSYGINTSKVELYMNIDITSDVIIPYKNASIINNFEILIASKVIQGEVPSLYNRAYDGQSSIINLN